ncbi:Fungal specific transcription factor domain-containing protein [Cladophialophora immunda]|nr:Fungal specific transcription factor domain-containing protein [Cladophialophora immunda]
MEQNIIQDPTIEVNPSDPSECILGGDTTHESPTYPQLLTPTNDDRSYSLSAEGHEADQQDGFYADYRSKADATSPYKKVGFASRLSSLGLILESSRRLSFLATTPTSKTTISLKLVANSQIQSLLDLFFADIDLVLPMMERPHMTERISSLLSDLGLPEAEDYVVHVSMEKCPLAALLCAILATAESLASDSVWSPQGKISGWAWYVQMQTLLQHFAKQDQPDMDVLSCFTLSSFYLLTLGKFREASEAIGLASQLAIASQLNVQDALLYTKHADARHYKRLWWSIYVMDQQISRIGGTPYWIRDQVTAVDDVLTPDRDASNLQNPGVSAATNTVLDYLQVLVHLARIGREIWDQQISIRQNTTRDRVAAAKIDSQLLRLSSSLPSHLAWRKMGVRGDDGIGSRHAIWQRLIISNKINSLRLLLRHDSLRPTEDHDSMLICQHLARTSISDIAAVMDSAELRHDLWAFTCPPR